MIDKNYFVAELPKQINRLGANPVVCVLLGDGSEYFVRGIDGVTDGYVMLNVYPIASAATFHAPSHYDVAKADSYPVTVPFELIARVQLSNSTQDQRPKVGFFS